ncbi:hypothetical protein AUJ46_00440 [Candidatus Peregrinibacteria bacterium CG1_02_54_53]|nr:MAG: hypothetical protein AUJ46_00440 [Candidatus Peregrinibacteria bacterium CG1_02_54_53]
MTSLELAQAFYDDAAQRQEGKVDSFNAELARQSHRVREDLTGSVRSELAVALEYATPQERIAAAYEIDHARGELKQAFCGSSLTLKKLDDDVAGEAQLDADVICIDPCKITGGDGIIDRHKAEDILAHEKEHTQQSFEADADSVTLGSETWQVDEVREIAAVSVQKRVDFLSERYRTFSRVTMDAHDRSLVRAGRFRQLEAEKNGFALST